MDSRAPRIGVGPVPTPAAKVRLPHVGAGAVRRDAVLDELDALGAKVNLVAAPAGFGKTTAIAQWCGDQAGPIAWAHLDFTDRDPLVLMSTLLAALRHADTITAEAMETLDGMTADEPAFSRWVLASFRSVIEGAHDRTVIVLDDIHDAVTPENASVLTAVVDSLPDGAVLVLLGRRRPDELPLDRWRGQGILGEISPSLLALSEAEAATVLTHTIGRKPDRATVRSVVERTEGWPVAVYLSASTATPVPPPAGTRDEVRSYLLREVLASLDAAVVEFLATTSMLGALSSPLCDHVLDRHDSQALLQAAAAETTLLAPLGAKGAWYRLHPLVRDVLLVELEANRGEDARRAHRRAGDWYDERGFAEEALAHTVRGGRADRFGETLWRYALPALLVGRASTVQGWIDRATGPESPNRMSAGLAMTAAWTAMMQGRSADVVRWTDEATARLGPGWDTRETQTVVEASVGTLVAARLTLGHQQSAWYAGNAFDHLPTDHLVRPLARLVHGLAVSLGGDLRHGRRLIEHSASLSESMGVATTWVEALSLRAVAEWADSDVDAAAESIKLANTVWLDRSLVDATATTILLCCAATAVHAARNEPDAARLAMARTDELAPAVQASLPWVGALRAVVNASAHVDLGDLAAAQAGVHQARRAMALLPAFPLFDRVLADVESRLKSAAVPAGLTPAEIRVAEHIDSPLSGAAIASELGLSYETVKSHLGSIYRKLGVVSRQEAAAVLRRARGR